MNPDQLEIMDGLDNLAVSAYEGRILNRLVSELRPNVILEIGTGNSYSTAWMAIALNPSAVLLTVDKEKRKRFQGLPIKYLTGNLVDFLDTLPKIIEFAFLDSDHTINVVKDDIEMVSSRIPDGGMIAVHDTLYREEMGKCLEDYFAGTDTRRLKEVGVKPSIERWDYKHLKTRFGLGIATKLGAKK